jgi:hypothetical protein
MPGSHTRVKAYGTRAARPTAGNEAKQKATLSEDRLLRDKSKGPVDTGRLAAYDAPV